MKRADLIEIFENLKLAISTQDLVPIFCNYCFGKDYIYGYNDVLCIQAPSQNENKFALHAVTLSGLLKNSTAEDVTFSFEEESVVVRCGKSKFKLPFYTAEEFIFETPEENWDFTVTIDEDNLAGLSACFLTSSKDNSLPALMGVTVAELIDADINFYSCDGDALSRFGKGEGAIQESYIMPNDFCDAVLKITDRTKCKLGNIRINGEWAKAELENGYVIYGRVLIHDDPLDFVEQISTMLQDAPVFCPAPVGIKEALSRACVIGNKDTELTIETEKMLLVTDSQAGVVRDVLRLRTHPNVAVKVSAALMQRSLEVCNEMAVLTNCTAYRRGNDLLQIISNIGT